MKLSLPISGLSLNQLTRDYWGSYDAAAIAQIAGLSGDACYTIKFYKAPDDSQEVFPAFGYVSCGLRITPGSLIWGFCLPCLATTGSAVIGSDTLPPQFTVQITDQSLLIDGEPHKWFSDPISSAFLANYKPTYESLVPAAMLGSFPNLLRRPYPVVGSGLFTVEMQETEGIEQRLELVFGVLEVCKQ